MDVHRLTENQKKTLGIIVFGAVIVRILLAVLSDNFNHPDENFQIYEQAHRLVFGYGIIPWEFRFSVRSWIVPGLMAGMLYPFKLFGCDNPNIYIPFIRIILGLISTIVIISAYFIGKKIYSPKAGLWAAFFCAGWYEIIYFSIRPLNEIWATTFFMAAVALAIKSNDNLKHAVAGILLALTIAVRFHYFPVVLLFVMVLFFINNRKQLVAFFIAFISGIVLVGIFEKLTIGGFYESYINYYEFSKSFSMTESSSGVNIYTFAKQLGYASLFMSWLFILLGIIIWRKVWYLLLFIAVALILHSVMPLKEHIVSIRFIYIIIPLTMTIGGISVSILIDKFNIRAAILGVVTTILFFLVSISGALNILPGDKEIYKHKIFYSDPGLSAYRFLYKQEKVVAVFDNADYWFHSGGFYYLHRDIPLYFNNNPPPSLNHVSHIVTKDNLLELEGFKLVKSYDNISVYSRADADFDYNIDYYYDPNMYQTGIDDNYRP